MNVSASLTTTRTRGIYAKSINQCAIRALLDAFCKKEGPGSLGSRHCCFSLRATMQHEVFPAAFPQILHFLEVRTTMRSMSLLEIHLTITTA